MIVFIIAIVGALFTIGYGMKKGVCGCGMILLSLICWPLALLIFVLSSPAPVRRNMACYCPNCRRVYERSILEGANDIVFCDQCGQTLRVTTVTMYKFNQANEQEKQAIMNAFERGEYCK